jgi:hypothetical protein
VPGINELMVDTPSPLKSDAANENVAMAIGQSAYAYPEQDHLGHIQAHLDFAKSPIFGSNPIIAPVFLPKSVEHIKQHLVLWYLNRMNGYVSKSLGIKMPDYAEEVDPKALDKLFGAASQHVEMDADATLKGVMPVIQQLVQSLQQFKPQVQMTPDVKVLLDTSMAETQRRAQRDQAEMQLKGQALQAKIQMDMKNLEISQMNDMEDMKLRLAIASNDNETKERIETARLTRDAAKLNFEQTKEVPYSGE